jgi:tetratricopeptide (TPR) repeat protein
MDRELDNIRAALALPHDVETRGRLAGALTHYWQVRGLLAEGWRWAETLLKDVSGMTPATEAGLHNTAGSLAVMMNDCEVARRHFEHTLAYFRTIGDQRNVAGMLSNIGVTALGQEQPAEAQRFFEESLAIYEGLGLETRRALTLANLGCAKLETGDFDGAAAALQRSAELQTGLGDECGLASTLASIAELELRRHRPQEAHSLVQQSLVLSQRLRLLPYLTLNSTLLALIAVEAGEAEAAAAWIGTANRLTEEGARLLTSREIIARVAQVRARLEAQLPAAAWEAAQKAGASRAEHWLGAAGEEAA